MADTDNRPDFMKIWASNSPLPPYTFTDENYLTGWNFIGSTPPSRSMFDAFMNKADLKMKWLYENAFSETSLAGFMFWRIPSTAYFVGELRTFKNGPLNVYLKCETAGMSSADAVESMPDDKKVGNSWQDGTVVWTIMEFADNSTVTKINETLTDSLSKHEQNASAHAAAFKTHNEDKTAHAEAFKAHIIISDTEPAYMDNAIWFKTK